MGLDDGCVVAGRVVKCPGTEMVAGEYKILLEPLQLLSENHLCQLLHV